MRILPSSEGFLRIILTVTSIRYRVRVLVRVVFQYLVLLQCIRILLYSNIRILCSDFVWCTFARGAFHPPRIIQALRPASSPRRTNIVYIVRRACFSVGDQPASRACNASNVSGQSTSFCASLCTEFRNLGINNI